MFEKEAEEYQKEVIAKKDYPHSIAVDWQRGAEFGFQKGIKARINTTTISDCPIKKEEAKIIIQDLLSNSDEYARQRAIDFLKEETRDDN